MIYPYRCEACGNTWEVIKRVSQIDDVEHCTACSHVGTRYIAQRQTFYGEKVEDAYFCPALGSVIKSKEHRNRVAKQKGLIEVGNDDPPAHDKYEKMRDENARNKYREFFEPISIRGGANA